MTSSKKQTDIFTFNEVLLYSRMQQYFGTDFMSENEIVYKVK